MIYDLNDFNQLPETAKHSLWFLRGIRDALADDLIAGVSHKELKREIENLCCYLSAHPSHVRSQLGREGFSIVNQFDVLWLVVKRIAKLEREACLYYVEPELITA